MFVFLGRLAPQKGVHLLLDCVGPLVRATAGRAHVLVCGCADPVRYRRRRYSPFLLLEG